MPWIRTVPAEKASGALKKIFEPALFAFMNRVVDGLGGELEGDMVDRARRYGLPIHPGTYEHLSAWRIG